VLAGLEPLLTPDERDRADRFKFDHLRRSFVLARGVLRVLLGRYLDIDPASIRFGYDEKGKPSLARRGPLKFNASHSGDMALYAFTLDCEIGVDVEQVRPFDDLRRIADRFFCAEETTDLMDLPEEQREAAFFRCWTRKEAYVKAIGEGLAVPLDGFAVSLRPDQPARLIHIGHDSEAAADWTLQNLEPAAGYAGAVAYCDAPRTLHQTTLVDASDVLSLKD
jgi:4'-phosphopantetheinyl transferase